MASSTLAHPAPYRDGMTVRRFSQVDAFAATPYLGNPVDRHGWLSAGGRPAHRSEVVQKCGIGHAPDVVVASQGTVRT